MSDHRAWRGCWCSSLLLFLPLAAAADDALLLGVMQGGADPALLRPALGLQHGQWIGLDNKLGESARNTGLPDFVQGNKVSDVTASLAQLASLLDVTPARLQHWHSSDNQGRPLQREALQAQQTRWSCESSWGLRLEKPAGMPGEWLLLANRLLELRHFSRVANVDANDPAWLAATPAQQAAALDLYRSQGALLAKVLGDRKLEQIAMSPRVTVSTQRVALDHGRAILAVTQQRRLGATEDDCAVPVLVDSAFFRIEKDGKAVRIASQSEVQDCGDGWEPGPREEAVAWLVAQGQPYLLQWSFGVEARRLGIHRIDPQTLAPAETPLASGGESGC